jgi:hypothetical protein
VHTRIGNKHGENQSLKGLPRQDKEVAKTCSVRRTVAM